MGLVDLVASAVMGLAHGFQIGFDMAKVRGAAFQGVDGDLRICLHLGLVCQCLRTLKKPLLVLFARDIGLERVVQRSDFGLFF